MLTFTELVKSLNKDTKIINTTENIVEETTKEVKQQNKISVGNKILDNISKLNKSNINMLQKGWIKSVVRELKNNKNISPDKISKIKKYIFSDNCTNTEYLALGGDATKQLFKHLDSGLNFQLAINMIYEESNKK